MNMCLPVFSEATWADMSQWSTSQPLQIPESQSVKHFCLLYTHVLAQTSSEVTQTDMSQWSTSQPLQIPESQSVKHFCLLYTHVLSQTSSEVTQTDMSQWSTSLPLQIPESQSVKHFCLLYTHVLACTSSEVTQTDMSQWSTSQPLQIPESQSVKHFCLLYTPVLAQTSSEVTQTDMSQWSTSQPLQIPESQYESVVYIPAPTNTRVSVCKMFLSSVHPCAWVYIFRGNLEWRKWVVSLALILNVTMKGKTKKYYVVIICQILQHKSTECGTLRAGENGQSAKDVCISEWSLSVANW